MVNVPELPPGETWDGLHQRYLDRLTARGLFDVSAWRVLLRASVVLGVNAALWLALVESRQWPMEIAFLVLVGPATMRIGFLVHELNHLALTRKWANALGLFLMTAIAGQANGHWVDQHHGHHDRMQEPLGDPDLDVDAFALSEESARQKTSLWGYTTRVQRWIFWPVATLMAFSIRIQTLIWTARNARRSPVHLLAFAVHFTLWLVIPAHFIGWMRTLLNYAFLHWAVGVCMMASFYWNHLGRTTFRPGDGVPWFARCYLGSRNLAGGRLRTILFGGLNYHIEHHLAPDVPIENLAAARRELVGVLAEVGLELPTWTWAGAMREVHEHVAAMSHIAASPTPQPIGEPLGVQAGE